MGNWSKGDVRETPVHYEIHTAFAVLSPGSARLED